MCMFLPIYTHRGRMRTNIDIDDALITEAIKATGAKTKKAAVEQGLRLLVRLAAQRRAVEDMIGLGWEGDLDASREGRGH
jgi:Arc/MetJ family transcription regulator